MVGRAGSLWAVTCWHRCFGCTAAASGTRCDTRALPPPLRRTLPPGPHSRRRPDPPAGGHLNPAVTLGTMISGHISLRKGLAYMAAQIAGGIMGARPVGARRGRGTPHASQRGGWPGGRQREAVGGALRSAAAAPHRDPASFCLPRRRRRRALSGCADPRRPTRHGQRRARLLHAPGRQVHPRGPGGRGQSVRGEWGGVHMCRAGRARVAAISRRRVLRGPKRAVRRPPRPARRLPPAHTCSCLAGRW